MQFNVCKCWVLFFIRFFESLPRSRLPGAVTAQQMLAVAPAGAQDDRRPMNRLFPFLMAAWASLSLAAADKEIVLIAGTPSHAPGEIGRAHV